MKNLKIRLPFLALLLGLGIFFTQSAFTSKPVARAYSYWRYNPNVSGSEKLAGQYTHITDGDAEECESGNDIICVLRVEEGIDTTPELQSYLNGFANNAAVTSSSAAYRKKLAD
jgi:hypothetical protein